jgi:mannose-6-phosphate isomerase-like protein (cupin superfamily)
MLAIQRTSLIGAAALAAVACSRTTPDTQWPPPPPSDGLPYLPFPEGSEEPGAASPEPAAGASGPKPIDASLPDAPPAALDRSAECKDKSCELKSWLPDPAFANGVPGGAASPAAIWSQRITAGSVLAVPRHHAIELVGVVLEGGVLLAADDGAAGRQLGKWDALRAPGAGVTLRASADGARLLLAIATGKATLAEALAHAKEKPWEVRWKKRPAPIATARLSDAKNHAWGGGAFHARIAFGGELQLPASLETLLASENAAIAEHDHPTWEHIAILEGKGTLTIAGAPHPVKPGALFHIPSGVKHAYAPAGSSRLLAVQIYTPSGPEQRFIKLAEEAAAKQAAE